MIKVRPKTHHEERIMGLHLCSLRGWYNYSLTDICRVNRDPLFEICIATFASWGHSKPGEERGPTTSPAVSPSPAGVEERPRDREGEKAQFCRLSDSKHASIGGSKSPKVDGILGATSSIFFGS